MSVNSGDPHICSATTMNELWSIDPTLYRLWVPMPSSRPATNVGFEPENPHGLPV